MEDIAPESEITPPAGTSALDATEVPLTPDAARFSKSALAVKFCRIRRAPPNSTTAIKLFGPAFASMNCVAARRANIWSGISMEELSKNRTR
jgi:hypothetical protein